MSETVRQKVNDFFDLVFGTIWETIEGFIYEVGAVFSFGAYSLKTFFSKPYRFKEFIQQMEFIGNKSIFIVVLTGTFTGMALSFQVYLGFRLVNATSLTGPIVAMGIARELGPVLTGLIVAARAGGAMAANLGSMRVSEQIDALESLSFDPVSFLILPRILAAAVMFPLLVIIADCFGIIGGLIAAVNAMDVSYLEFIRGLRSWFRPWDAWFGLIKGLFFLLYILQTFLISSESL